MADPSGTEARAGAGAPAGRRRALVAAGFAASLALLLAHAAWYRFLCDDAYIAFRYARNLAEGHGLVFNPGFDRVEGYTQFLWIVLLAAFHRLGVPAERAANPLLALFTVALWAVLARAQVRRLRDGRAAWTAVAPLLLLGATRSVAVWSTSGLETRLYELLVVWGVLAAESAVRGERRGGFARLGLVFGLAALARPDGVLFAASATVVVAVALRRRGRSLAPLAREGALFVAIVGGHYLFRRWYYGEWLPNTWYAKVGERQLLGVGWTYVRAFLLEYGAFLWIPPLVLAAVRHARRGTLFVPALYAAVVGTHACYILSVGDHFEYRPLDTYFPFAYLLVGDGLAQWAEGRRGRLLAPLWAAVVAVGVVAIPLRSRLDYPERYIVGFPGYARGSSVEADRYLETEGHPFFGLPLVSAWGEAHRELLNAITWRYAGIRWEEHRYFLATALREGRELRRLVDEGLIPPDAHIATDSVGAISYLSRLRTLDRLGLNDRGVAHGGISNPQFIHHSKRATFEYARERGVDLWARDNVFFVWRPWDAELGESLRTARLFTVPVWVADVGPDRFLLVMLPQGVEAASERFPALEFRSIREPEVYRELLRRIDAAGPLQGRRYRGLPRDADARAAR